MGTCGTDRAALTNSVMTRKKSKEIEAQIKNEDDSVFKDIKEVEEEEIKGESKEGKNKNESIIKELEQSKKETNDKDLKRSITLKPEVNKKNIDIRRSQTLTKSQKEEKELKEAMDSLHNDIFEKPINIYTEPGKPHPPFEIINKQLVVSLCRIINKNNKEAIGFFLSYSISFFKFLITSFNC